MLAAFVGTYLLAWWCNAPAFTSISNATMLGLLASGLFCVTWSAVVLLYCKNRIILWTSFLITLCPLLVFAINAIGLYRYLNLYSFSYACALFAYMPYLGFGFLSEPLILFVIGLQCFVFFILLVTICKKALIAPVVVIALWLAITWRIPLDALAPVPNHINAISVTIDNVNQEDWGTVDITEYALGESIYQAIQDTTVRYVSPSDKIVYGDDDCILTLRLGGNDIDLTDDGSVYINNQKFVCNNGTALYELLLETAEHG